MVELTESFVDSLAPNSAASKNGRDLVKKKKLSKLHRSADGIVLFGECAGSGSSSYNCSADFAEPEKPVFRCNCPSRQFPCKHGLGLLYAYTGGLEFSVAELPEDLASKREKAEQRAQKAQAEEASGEGKAAKPRKVNKSALAKKIQSQLDGLELLEKLTHTVIRNGLATLDKKGIKQIQEQAKQLGNHYLPGAQSELRALALLLEDAKDDEALYTAALEQLACLHAIIRKGRPYLAAKQEDPELKPDVESAIEEWLGHAWQLAELQAHGLVQENRQLAQLAFTSYNDAARQEYVDVGYWLELDNGAVHRQLNYRPYKAAKYIKEDDSYFELATAAQLYYYPGTMNRRIRMDGLSSEPLASGHLACIRAAAEPSLADAIKKVKNELKNPLGNKQPALLVRIEAVLETEAGQLAIQCQGGQQLQLGDVPRFGHATVELLRLIPPEELAGAAMLLLFAHLPEACRLIAQPLAVINEHQAIRLWY